LTISISIPMLVIKARVIFIHSISTYRREQLSPRICVGYRSGYV
jgi:hypothetical protein